MEKLTKKQEDDMLEGQRYAETDLEEAEAEAAEQRAKEDEELAGEFNLSERIWTIHNLEQAKVFPLECISIFNVKEFIGRIADKCFVIDGKIVVDIEDVKKLAGEKLI